MRCRGNEQGKEEHETLQNMSHGYEIKQKRNSHVTKKCREKK
jgi:hypothetical protein